MMSRRATCASLMLAAILVGSVATQAAEGPSWSYDEPRQWAERSPEYAACGAGRNQSPVDIVAPLEAELPTPIPDYPVAGRTAVNNGHTLKIAFPPGNTLAVEGRHYRLRQLHFHVPAEHRIGGRRFPLEAHLVHEDEAGRLAVLAILFEEGEPASALAEWLDQAPEAEGQRVELQAGVDAGALLGETRDFYRLNGSLTTPPCSEGVLWWVAKAPHSIGASQLATMSRLIGEANNRPLQPLNARRVLD